MADDWIVQHDDEPDAEALTPAVSAPLRGGPEIPSSWLERAGSAARGVGGWLSGFLDPLGLIREGPIGREIGQTQRLMRAGKPWVAGLFVDEGLLDLPIRPLPKDATPEQVAEVWARFKARTPPLTGPVAEEWRRVGEESQHRALGLPFRPGEATISTVLEPIRRARAGEQVWRGAAELLKPAMQSLAPEAYGDLDRPLSQLAHDIVNPPREEDYSLFRRGVASAAGITAELAPALPFFLFTMGSASAARLRAVSPGAAGRTASRAAAGTTPRTVQRMVGTNARGQEVWKTLEVGIDESIADDVASVLTAEARAAFASPDPRAGTALVRYGRTADTGASVSANRWGRFWQNADTALEKKFPELVESQRQYLLQEMTKQLGYEAMPAWRYRGRRIGRGARTSYPQTQAGRRVANVTVEEAVAADAAPTRAGARFRDDIAFYTTPQREELARIAERARTETRLLPEEAFAQVEARLRARRLQAATARVSGLEQSRSMWEDTWRRQGGGAVEPQEAPEAAARPETTPSPTPAPEAAPVPPTAQQQPPVQARAPEEMLAEVTQAFQTAAPATADAHEWDLTVGLDAAVQTYEALGATHEARNAVAVSVHRGLEQNPLVPREPGGTISIARKSAIGVQMHRLTTALDEAQALADVAHQTAMAARPVGVLDDRAARKLVRSFTTRLRDDGAVLAEALKEQPWRGQPADTAELIRTLQHGPPTERAIEARALKGEQWGAQVRMAESAARIPELEQAVAARIASSQAAGEAAIAQALAAGATEEQAALFGDEVRVIAEQGKPAIPEEQIWAPEEGDRFADEEAVLGPPPEAQFSRQSLQELQGELDEAKRLDLLANARARYELEKVPIPEELLLPEELLYGEFKQVTPHSGTPDMARLEVINAERLKTIRTAEERLGRQPARYEEPKYRIVTEEEAAGFIADEQLSQDRVDADTFVRMVTAAAEQVGIDAAEAGQAAAAAQITRIDGLLATARGNVSALEKGTAGTPTTAEMAQNAYDLEVAAAERRYAEAAGIGRAGQTDMPESAMGRIYWLATKGALRYAGVVPEVRRVLMEGMAAQGRDVDLVIGDTHRIVGARPDLKLGPIPAEDHGLIQIIAALQTPSELIESLYEMEAGTTLDWRTAAADFLLAVAAPDVELSSVVGGAFGELIPGSLPPYAQQLWDAATNWGALFKNVDKGESVYRSLREAMEYTAQVTGRDAPGIIENYTPQIAGDLLTPQTLQNVLGPPQGLPPNFYERLTKQRKLADFVVKFLRFAKDKAAGVDADELAALAADFDIIEQGAAYASQYGAYMARTHAIDVAVRHGHAREEILAEVGEEGLAELEALGWRGMTQGGHPVEGMETRMLPPQLADALEEFLGHGDRVALASTFLGEAGQLAKETLRPLQAGLLVTLKFWLTQPIEAAANIFFSRNLSPLTRRGVAAAHRLVALDYVEAFSRVPPNTRAEQFQFKLARIWERAAEAFAPDVDPRFVMETLKLAHERGIITGGFGGQVGEEVKGGMNRIRKFLHIGHGEFASAGDVGLEAIFMTDQVARAMIFVEEVLAGATPTEASLAVDADTVNYDPRMIDPWMEPMQTFFWYWRYRAERLKQFAKFPTRRPGPSAAAIRAYEKRDEIMGIDKRRRLFQTGRAPWLRMMTEALPATWNLPMFGIPMVKQALLDAPLVREVDGFYLPFVRVRIPHVEEPGQYLQTASDVVGETERSMLPGVQIAQRVAQRGSTARTVANSLPVVGYYTRMFEKIPAGGEAWGWEWFIRQGQMPPDEYFEAMVDANRTPKRAKPRLSVGATSTGDDQRPLWKKERRVEGQRRSQYRAGQYEVQKARLLFAVELANNTWGFSLYVVPVKPMLSRMLRGDLEKLLRLEDEAAARGESRYFERKDILKTTERGNNPRNWQEQMGGAFKFVSEAMTPDPPPERSWYNPPASALLQPAVETSNVQAQP